MKRSLHALLSLILVLGFSCGSRTKSAGFDANLEWTNIEKQAADLKAMRIQVEDLKNQIAKWEAEKRTPGTYKPEELPLKSMEVLKAQLDTLVNGKIKSATTAFWDLLTQFMNMALNNKKLKALPETAKAVRLYSDETIVLADEAIQSEGNYDQALTILQQALQYDQGYKALQDRITRTMEFRFLPQGRFDAVAKGVGMADVKALCGVPNPVNIKEKTEKGKTLTAWFYPRQDQKSAGFFFQDGKLYEKQWDTQKR